MNTCATTGKISHPTRSAAIKAWSAAKRRKDDGAQRHVYQCPFCKQFHFGRPIRHRHDTEEAKRRREIRRLARQGLEFLEDHP